MEIEEAVELLEKIAKYDGSEYGEYCSALLTFYERMHYEAQESLVEEIVNEIKNQAVLFQENYKFVEKEETVTRKIITIENKELVE